MVVAGRAEVSKGSIARYRALAAVTVGTVDDADRHFGAAVEAHRRLGAPLLLAQTLEEWAGSLTGRDDMRASALPRESATLAQAA